MLNILNYDMKRIFIIGICLFAVVFSGCCRWTYEPWWADDPSIELGDE